ncbi:hypothetical protein ONZ45_g14425 [Pleurotus djamor]|nr:hypothetical protein ONZ45_g14425 [Pleurotus djamor]
MVREEAEAKQKQIQRQLKEEIEILKTQFAFKQQELQSSLHGPTVPGSARPKKLSNLVSSTPLAKTTTWEHIPGPSARPFETPRRNRYLPSQADNSKLANPRFMKSPAAARKSAMLPGFENAFMPSSPVKGTQATSNKGKMRAVIPQEMDIFEQPGPQSPISNTEDLFGMDVDPAPQMVAEMTQPAKGGSSAVVPAPTKEVVIESIEPFDFNAELLVAVNVPESKEYVEACASVIRVLATKSDHPTSFQLNVQTITDAFTQMLPILISSRLVEDVHKLILCFFGTLSSDAEALEVLAGSPMLIPSICTYIYNLALPLWEEDVRLSAHPELADNIVQSIRIALFLLHHLVFSPKSDVDLVSKLQQAPPRHLNGAIHTFIVCIGRLSYAEPPSWMTPQASQALERVVDLARELIEQVVDGPEGDAVWEVYHGEFRGVNMDEEEMEAQLLGTQASV